MVSRLIKKQQVWLGQQDLAQAHPHLPAATATSHIMCEKEKTRKEKTTPFGVDLMRSQVTYQSAQHIECAGMHKLTHSVTRHMFSIRVRCTQCCVTPGMAVSVPTMMSVDAAEIGLEEKGLIRKEKKR